MSEGLNKVMLLGYLGEDAELHAFEGGAVLKLRLATSERYQDRSGQWQERTEWHSVSVFGKRGEALAKILHKGHGVFVEGRLHTRSYEKDGEKRYSTGVVANNIVITKNPGKRDESGEPAAPRTTSYTPRPQPAAGSSARAGVV